MKELLEASQNERAQYFQEAAARSQHIKNPIIMEKDFWVCWTLNQIFSIPTLAPHITFKGGTSLSKCYHYIERFSEDIDLTLSKQYIGMNEGNDPATASATNQRGKRLDKLTEEVKNKISNNIKPILQEKFTNNIPTDTAWKLETDEKDEQTLIFHYPSSFETKPDEYIQSAIKLEFGARGDISPSEPKIISSYTQQLLPELFEGSTEICVTVLKAERTYWEKITLLHAEYHRNPQKPLPNRLFRHYYDIVMLDQNNLTINALQNLELLDDVVKNKSIYFPSKWANYDNAKIGTLHLYPSEAFIVPLKQDYRKMTDMFFADPPDFEETLGKIKRIEDLINER